MKSLLKQSLTSLIALVYLWAAVTDAGICKTYFVSLFQCATQSQCIPLVEVCDGVRNCKDGSDESLCVNLNETVNWVTDEVTCLEAKISNYRRRVANIKKLANSMFDTVPRCLNEKNRKDFKPCLVLGCPKEGNFESMEMHDKKMKHKLLDRFIARLDELDADLELWSNNVKLLGSLFHSHRQLCNGTDAGLNWPEESCSNESEMFQVSTLWLFRYKTPIRGVEEKLYDVGSELKTIIIDNYDFFHTDSYTNDLLKVLIL